MQAGLMHVAADSGLMAAEDADDGALVSAEGSDGFTTVLDDSRAAALPPVKSARFA
jgi:hypothetical protein